MATSDGLERRPDSVGRNAVRYPEEWGKPPADPLERRIWVESWTRKGINRRARGEDVSWASGESR